MAVILCPTRGGEASYPTQDRAIELAQEQGAELVFLYVTDVRFLFRGSAALVLDLEEELDEMGEFLLTMAQERAAGSGLQAEIVIQHGSFHDAVVDTIDAYEVTTVVFGAPEEGESHTTREYLQELSEELKQEKGVQVELVNPPPPPEEAEGAGGA